MINFLIILVFIITVAIASGSIVLSSHLKTTYQSDLFSTLLYFLAFYFTFGFYALWGQLLVFSFLHTYVATDVLGKIVDIMVLLGSPFIVFASVMFIKLTREMSGLKTGNTFILGYIIGSVFIIISIGYTLLNQEQMQVNMRYYFVLLIVLFTAIGIYFLIFFTKKTHQFKRLDRIRISIGLVLSLIVELVSVRFYNDHILFAQLFIFAYFIYGGFIPIYVKYTADLSMFILKNGHQESFEQFCEMHQISHRERDIIAEICQGLTNQQIADRLFISLQTVKDHTHRIYVKTNCSNRAQLIRMVSESSQPRLTK